MFLSVRWEDDKEDIKEVTINSTVNATKGMLPTEVLLDNAADISAIHPMLLKNVRDGKRKIRVKEVGGD